MQLITPSECLTKLQNFNNRIDRLKANQYVLPRLRTHDLNALVIDMKLIKYWASIGKFNKNQERAISIIYKTNDNIFLAIKFNQREKEQVNTKKKGSYVSRSVYQEIKEENKKLLADIKTLVTADIDFDGFMECHTKWFDHFREEKEMNDMLKSVSNDMVLKNPERYPDFLVKKAKENKERENGTSTPEED